MRRRTFLALAGAGATTGCLRLQGGGSTATTATTDTGTSTSTTDTPDTAGQATEAAGEQTESEPTDDPAPLSLTPAWSLSEDFVIRLWANAGSFYGTTGRTVRKVTADGENRWQGETAAESYYPRTAGFGPETTVVTYDETEGSSPATLLAYDDGSGAVRWSHDAPDDGNHYRSRAVSVTGDIVVFATQADGGGDEQRPRVTALDKNSGERRWHVDIEDGFVTDLVPWQGRLYVMMTDQVLDIDIQSGARNANYDVFAGFATYTRSDDTLYGGSNPVESRSLPGYDQQWEQQVIAEVNTRPAIVGDSLVVGTEAGHVIALDRGTGERRWRARVNSQVRTLYQAQRYVWVADNSGFVYAFDPASGTKLLTDEPDELGDSRQLAVIDDTVLINTQAYTVEKE
ncbi:PQQ-binding-like beta-propeller repeat protein [Haloarchaeobius sp. DYHT-AS-18]|uniref:outer membrane protein assembly factor BamB family protein n=1 Tax=Haloarchaeobius sp. DYHT-AS-18 TaxID=3446117 RepID=UPI003EB72D03